MEADYHLDEFVCARCGNCCRGEGYVRVSPEEVRRIAEHLNVSIADFQTQYCRLPEIEEQAALGDLWLLDQPGPEQECIFLRNNHCVVQPVKPDQCIAFPLKWRTPDILDYCEGMRR